MIAYFCAVRGKAPSERLGTALPPFISLWCLARRPPFLFLRFERMMKVMSEAAKVEAKERFDRGDYMGAAKVATAVTLT